MSTRPDCFNKTHLVLGELVKQDKHFLEFFKLGDLPRADMLLAAVDIHDVIVAAHQQRLCDENSQWELVNPGSVTVHAIIISAISCENTAIRIATNIILTLHLSYIM